MEGICDNCRNAKQCDSAKTMIGIRIECNMFIPKDRKVIRGSDFLTHAETIGTELEAAYRIVMELQKRNLLKVKIDKNGKEPLITWELKCIEDT